MTQDQIRAKSLALFHALVSNWANQLRKDVTGMQDEIIQKLDSLQERMSKYEEIIDEERILAFANEAASLMGGGGGGGAKLSLVRDSIAKIDRGGSLTEVLTILLAELSQFAPRVALFILKGNSCIGWNGRGFDQSPGFNNDGIKRISVPMTADTVFRAVVESKSSFLGESTGQRDNVHILSRIGNVLPSNIFATPLILRDRIAAVVYADSGEGPETLEGTEAIEILTSYASKLLDAISGGTKGASRPEAVPAEPSSPPNPVSDSVSSFGTPAPAPKPAPAPTKTATAAGPNLDSLDPESRKQHEDAMRFARLLVSEIKLYNEAKVQQGRSNRGIYNLLKDDIERSRQLYKERVPDPIRTSTNYFNEELVRILADGDTSAMGHPMG